jgi:hypothetical protein
MAYVMHDQCSHTVTQQHNVLNKVPAIVICKLQITW